jgi:hypothetical protein
MSKLKKTILIVSGIFVFTLICTGAALYLTYNQSLSNEADIKLSPFSLSPEKDIKLGDVITASLDVACPWGHYPETAELTTTEGIQVVSEPVISKIKNKWGKAIWKISTEIQSYRTGKIKEEKCVITFLNSKEKAKSRQITTTIPGFNVLSVETGRERKLNLAGKVVPSPITRTNTWVMLLLAILAFSGIVIFALVWYKKRKTMQDEIVIPPWALAISMLHDLRSELKNHLINKQLCFTKLTDIVRNYLEKRFALNVTAQTTHEFLTDLDKGGTPLSSEYRNFLRNFMTASDLVKFAKLPADASLLEDAMKKAEELVTSTTPTEEELIEQEKENAS